MRSKLEKAVAVAAFTLRAVVITAAILSCPNPAFAIPLEWTLNATFNDGGTAAGAFTFDANTNIYSTFNISVTGGNTTLFPPFTYSPSTSFLRPPLDATDLSLSSNDVVFVPLPGGGVRGDRRTLFITFEEALTDAGGSIRVLNPPGLGGDAEFNTLPDSPPFGQRAFTGGSVEVVPEPTTLLLFGTTMAGLGLARWRRRRQS